VVLFNKYQYVDQMDEFGWSCSTHRRNDIYIYIFKISEGKIENIRHLGDIGIYGGKI
jgi:hypothetical protein